MVLGIEVFVEMYFYFLCFCVLCMVENVMYNLYNLLILCGVLVCDLCVWLGYFIEVIDIFVD